MTNNLSMKRGDYFGLEILKDMNDNYEKKRVCVSGSGNVSLFVVEKLIEMGARVLTVSDRFGTLYFSKGILKEELKELMDIKFNKKGKLQDSQLGKYFEGKKPWDISPCDIAIPCAIQNEILIEDAKKLVKGGCKILLEGANMPTNLEATKYLIEKGIYFAPGKVSNAGGVSVSGLEISQNATHLPWKEEDVDKTLQKIMKGIYMACLDYGREGSSVNLLKGANIAGFIKVAELMIAHSLV